MKTDNWEKPNTGIHRNKINNLKSTDDSVAALKNKHRNQHLVYRKKKKRFHKHYEEMFVFGCNCRSQISLAISF